VGFFTGNGRIGRLTYLLANVAIGVVVVVSVLALIETDPVTGATTGINPMLLVVYAVALWASVGAMICRLHDRGHSGYLWLLSFVPLVGLGLGLYLLLAPGDETTNRFGPPPGATGKIDREDQRRRADALAAAAADAYQAREDAYLNEDGSFDMDGLATSMARPGPSSVGPRPEPGDGSEMDRHWPPPA
jgi:uncharacterized membrane protein YhaH (DUF805 family)